MLRQEVSSLLYVLIFYISIRCRPILEKSRVLRHSNWLPSRRHRFQFSFITLSYHMFTWKSFPIKKKKKKYSKKVKNDTINALKASRGLLHTWKQKTKRVPFEGWFPFTLVHAISLEQSRQRKRSNNSRLYDYLFRTMHALLPTV